MSKKGSSIIKIDETRAKEILKKMMKIRNSNKTFGEFYEEAIKTIDPKNKEETIFFGYVFGRFVEENEHLNEMEKLLLDRLHTILG